MFNSIFELETGVGYHNESDIVTCHVCGKTYSPVETITIPTGLCAFYSGTYKRMCAIYYLSSNICSHILLPGSKWGSIFIGDVESLPTTIRAKLEDVILQQPDHEQASKAWNEAIMKFKESRVGSV